ncbi:uncharacterized protein LOC143250235 isoform X2 [Tachypleus tridentatus]
MCLSNLSVHTGGTVAVSKRYQDNEGNFAYSVQTDTHHGITYFQKGDKTPHPAAIVSGIPVGHPNGASLPPPTGAAPLPISSPLQNSPSPLNIVSNTRRKDVPVYPPINTDFLYTMGYIYLKDFQPESFQY